MTLSACGSSGPSASSALAAFDSAWDRGDTTAMAALSYPSLPGLPAEMAATTAGLGSFSAQHVAGPAVVHGATATASITSSYHLGGLGAWGTRTPVTLSRHGGEWLVDWSPRVVVPGPGTGDRLRLNLVWAPRAVILGASGVALTPDQDEVEVGVEGSRVKDPTALTSLLVKAGATPAAAAAALAAASAHPSFFEPVLALSEAQYAALGGNSGALHAAPGTVFRHVASRTPLTPGLAAHLVGTTGPITAQELEALGAPYDASSVVGQNGLEAAYEKHLAGSPGATVVAVDAKGSAVSTLATFPARAGTAVTTGIDPKVQSAVEAAMQGLTGPAAMIAVSASTGAVLADLSLPATDQVDEALRGEFPPGSTFKVITSSALLSSGLTPSSAATCPAEVTVDGRVFNNAEGDHPVSDLAEAFAESCNTAFVQLATAHLSGTALVSAAGKFQLGTAPRMGLSAFGGSVPEPSDGADLAATAIGQGRVVVSPLDLAMVAAAVDSGSVRAPRLVVGSPDDSVAPVPLEPTVVSGLRQMMAAVVATGTAAGTGLPAGTFAKTGTAEYGAPVNGHLPVDAWLMGYRGDVAFAILYQDAPGNGGPVCGPIAARFLNALGS